MAIVTRYKIYPASSISGYGPTCEEKGSIQYGELDGKTGRTVFGIRWIGAVPRVSTDGFTNFPSTVGEHNLIPNLISKLPYGSDRLHFAFRWTIMGTPLTYYPSRAPMNVDYVQHHLYRPKLLHTFLHRPSSHEMRSKINHRCQYGCSSYCSRWLG